MPATNELLQEGRYRVSQPLSRDGTVFEAYDTVRNTTVLVREFPVRLNKVTTVSQRESLQLAFANQAKVLSEIDHESLIHVEDYFSEIDRQFLVMESVEGETLYDLLNHSKRPFPVTEVLRWADQLLDALDYIHSLKPSVVHRSIRPQNVRLSPAGKIKLLGVGLDDGGQPDLTETHADDGDLRYSPMEQIWPGLDAASQKVITNSYDDRSERILKEPLDARSDIYSLGATLYFLITGREPVDPLERSIDILEGKLDPLREPTKVESRIPADISDVLMKALEIKRENRYDSAVIMRQVLKTAIARVEEREAEDAREQEEAAEILRQASSKPKASLTVDVSAPEQLRQEELLQTQLREAETERLAEQEAEAAREAKELEEAARLEAERLEAEKSAARIAEAERAEAERLALEAEEEKEADVSADDLLEIAVSAEVTAYRDDSKSVDENELAAVLEELEKAELEADDQRTPIETSAEPNVEDNHDAVHSETEVPASAEDASDRSVDTDLFAGTDKRGFSLPIRAIAGAIGLGIVIAVSAWMMMSGPSAPTPQTQLEPVPVQVVQPVQSDTTAPSESVASTDAPNSDANSSSVKTGQQPTAPKAAPTVKPKKPEAKTEKKKAVTVDDLINDN